MYGNSIQQFIKVMLS